MVERKKHTPRTVMMLPKSGGGTRAFSSEGLSPAKTGMDAGLRRENAAKQQIRAPFRFNRNGKGSSARTHSLRSRVSALIVYFASILPNSGCSLRLDRCSSEALQRFFLGRRGRIGQAFAGAAKPGVRALAGISVCLAFGLSAASDGEKLAALTPNGAYPNSGNLIQQYYEHFGQFAQGSTPSFIAREIHGDPSNPIPLTIKLPDIGRTKYKFIMLTGLPDDFHMSSGFRTKNAWLVSVRELDTLQIVPDKNFVGKFTLRIHIVSEGNKAEEQSVAVNIRPKTDEAPKSVSPNVGSTSSMNARSETVPPAAPPPKKLLSENEENTAMQRATEFLVNADIAAVRLIYETLAMKGSARAAFAMGQTYDPEFLAGKRIEGLKPDIEHARWWYRKALALGSQDAKARLVNLDGQ